jgi:prepilin-type N-terminal cleavage/methylation domain-containing protein
MLRNLNLKLKIQNFRKGFSLIELIVAMFIFGLVMVAMVAVSVAGFRSYGKSKAIKTVTEDVGFAINSIAKDVRMGRIESDDVPIANGPSSVLIVTRNSTQTIVRYEKTSTKLSSCECATVACPPASRTRCSDIVDLSSAGMTFDATSGFHNQKTAPIPNPTVRGWAEINLNIASPSMETDSISVQTIVSSRDYGWEAVLP